MRLSEPTVRELKAQLRGELLDAIAEAQEAAIRVVMSSCTSDRLLKWAMRYVERCTVDVARLRRL